jgi:hypothetical protein
LLWAVRPLFLVKLFPQTAHAHKDSEAVAEAEAVADIFLFLILDFRNICTQIFAEK